MQLRPAEALQQVLERRMMCQPYLPAVAGRGDSGGQQLVVGLLQLGVTLRSRAAMPAFLKTALLYQAADPE